MEPKIERSNPKCLLSEAILTNMLIVTYYKSDRVDIESTRIGYEMSPPKVQRLELSTCKQFNFRLLNVSFCFCFCWGSWAFRTHVIRAVSALDVESSAVPACVFLSFTTSVCCIKQSTQVFLLSGCVEDWGLALVNVRMQNNLLLWYSSSRDEICQTCQRQRVYVSYHVDRGRLLPVNGFS